MCTCVGVCDSVLMVGVVYVVIGKLPKYMQSFLSSSNTSETDTICDIFHFNYERF